MLKLQLETTLAEQQSRLDDALKHHTTFVERARYVDLPDRTSQQPRCMPALS
jgi:hypothetical protein